MILLFENFSKTVNQGKHSAVFLAVNNSKRQRYQTVVGSFDPKISSSDATTHSRNSKNDGRN
jgi:hypothetical protein